MPEWEHLSRAPIVEALLDIRVANPAAVDVAALNALCNSLATQFPSRQELQQFAWQFTLNPETPVSVSQQPEGPRGFLLRSPDEKQVVQFRLDGFTVSQLQPYRSWASLRGEAEQLWQRYRGALQPMKVTRVAVRFINRIAVPQGTSLEQTFKTTFLLATSLPKAVSGFLLRIVIPFEQDGAVAILSQTTEPDGLNCIFDLDVSAERSEGFMESEIWTKLERLREIKNLLFFESLTSSALGQFR
jgi:uncharacterized protein (TIGR04255 family)